MSAQQLPSYIVLGILAMLAGSSICHTLCQNLNCLRIRKGFVHKIVLIQGIIPSVSNVVFMTTVSAFLNAASL